MVKKEKVLIFIVSFLFFSLTFGNIPIAAAGSVYDYAGLFSEEEKNQIQQQAAQVSEQLALDIVIVTTKEVQGKSSKQYAEDFYLENNFGYSGTSDGILYLLNMQDREVYIYTKDKAFDYIPDYEVEEILDQVYPYLTEDHFLESVNSFLTEVELKMQEDSTSGGSTVGGSSGYSEYPYEEGAGSSDDLTLTQELFIYFFVSITVGGIAIGIMAMLNRGRSTVNANTYLENGSFMVTSSVDQHFDTRVTQQVIQQNTNNGSGGSFGGGGSGGSGGGGRSF